jgi:hypothetical protein
MTALMIPLAWQTWWFSALPVAFIALVFWKVAWRELV